MPDARYRASYRNHTDEPRFAYAAQYQSDHAREAATGRKDPKRMRARDLAARRAEHREGAAA